MGTKRFLDPRLGVWHHGDQLWTFCPMLGHELSPPGICPPSNSIHPLRVCSGSGLQASPPRMCLCAHACIHALHGHRQVSTDSHPRLIYSLPTSNHMHL